jgi:hypothetical protein
MRWRIFIIELELCASHYVFLAPLDTPESSYDILEPTDGKHNSNSEFCRSLVYLLVARTLTSGLSDFKHSHNKLDPNRANPSLTLSIKIWLTLGIQTSPTPTTSSTPTGSSTPTVS